MTDESTEARVHQLIMVLLGITEPRDTSADAQKLAQMMPSEHRQKLIELGYMAIQSSDTPIMWWSYLLELATSDVGEDLLAKIQEMIERRIRTGKWI